MRIRRALLSLTALGLLAGGSSPATAQSPPKVGEAVAARIDGPSGRVELVRAVLGATGMSEASSDALKDWKLAAGLATAVTTGTTEVAGATSIATLANVDLLAGLVTARSIVAMATATANGSNAAGSGFEGLAIRGVMIPGGDGVAPNTRIALPGLGYVVLNEQVRQGDVLTVTMIRLVIEATSLAPKRELVVASARSGR
jgi:hypothetical protein